MYFVYKKNGKGKKYKMYNKFINIFFFLIKGLKMLFLCKNNKTFVKKKFF